MLLPHLEVRGREVRSQKVRGQENAVPLECPAILSHSSSGWVELTQRRSRALTRTWEVWFEFTLLTLSG